MNTESNWVLNLLSDVGSDVGELQRLHPAEFAQLALDPTVITMEPALVVLNAAAEQANDPDLGLHLAEHTDFKNTGVYGYLLCNAQTLGEFLEFADRYYNILFHTTMVRFRRLKKVSRFEYRILTPTKSPQRPDIEWGLATYICFIRQQLGDEWCPNAVQLSFETPDDTSEQRRIFGENIHYSAKTNYFELDNELLDLQINDSDPELLKVVKAYADELMSDIAANDSLYHRVRLLTMQGISDAKLNAEQVASHLGMSPSTMRRRLADYQLTFRLIREEIVESLAKQSLEETRLPVSSIALELGYSESAAFNHAFKRMTGLTPSEYRDRNQRL